MKKLSAYLKTFIEIPRIKVGKKQTIETLIKEETLIFGKFLRGERSEWNSRRMLLKMEKPINSECVIMG